MYTVIAIQKIWQTVKNFSLAATLLTQICYIAYLVYALITGTGHWFFNVPLLAASLGFLIFTITLYCPRKETDPAKSRKKKKRAQKRAKRLMKSVKNYFDWFKLGIKAATVIISLYSIYIAVTHISVITVILAAFSFILFLFQLLFEIAEIVFHRLYYYLRAGIELDTEAVASPLHLWHAKEDDKELEKIKENLRKAREKAKSERALAKEARRAARRARQAKKRERYHMIRKKGSTPTEPSEGGAPAEARALTAEDVAQPRKRKLREVFCRKVSTAAEEKREAGDKRPEETSQKNRHRRRR